MNLSDKERIIIKVFLETYKKLLNDENSIPFNPRSVTIVSQPDMNNERLFHWTSYNKWFDEVEVVARHGASTSLLETFLDIPISILITAEELGKSLVSIKNQKKLTKALKLLSEIKIERQYEKD